MLFNQTKKRPAKPVRKVSPTPPPEKQPQVISRALASTKYYNKSILDKIEALESYSFSSKSKTITLHTRDILITYKDDTYNLGKYEVIIQLERPKNSTAIPIEILSKERTFRPLKPEEDREDYYDYLERLPYPHPHVNKPFSDNPERNICWGGYKQLIHYAYKKEDFNSVVLYVIIFLNSYNEDDPHEPIDHGDFPLWNT